MADQSSTLSIILNAKDGISGVLSALKGSFSSMGDAGANAGKQLDELAKSGGGLSSAFKVVGGLAAGAVAFAIADIGVKSIKSAADFQSGMLVMQTSAGEIQKNMNMVSAGVLNIATSVGVSAQQLVGPNGPLYQIESAGFHGADGLKILTAATQGARAEGADFTKVADAVTSTLIDYHLKAKDSADVTSKLVAAVGAGKANFEQFTGALHSVLPIASAMHVPLNDILGDLASMTQHGMSADQATQNLAHSLLKLQKPTVEMNTELSSLGINSADLSQMLSEKGLSGTMNYISDSVMTKLGGKTQMLVSAFNNNKQMAKDVMLEYSAMPASLQKIADAYTSGSISVKDYRTTMKGLPTDQANLLQQYVSLAGRSQGFSQILKSGKNPLQDYAQAMQAATGDSTTLQTALLISGENAGNTAKAISAVAKAHADAAGKVQGFALWQGTLNGKMAEAKSAISNAGIALGTAFLPAVTAVVKVVSDIISPIAAWVNTHQKLAGIIFASIGAFAALTATLLTISFAMGKVKQAFGFMGMFSKGTKEVSKFTGVIDEVGKSTGKISKVTEDVGKGIGGFIEGILKPLGSTAVLKGAASAALVGIAIYAIALGVNQASKDKINLANLGIMAAALVITAGIFSLLSFISEFAIPGAATAAIVGLGLWVAAEGISKASDLSKNISETNLLKLSGGLAMVSAILAVSAGLAAFGAIGAVFDAVIGRGLVIAADGLRKASMIAAAIAPKSLTDLFDLVKKLGNLNAGSLMGDLLNMVKTASMSKIAVEILDTATNLNKVPDVKASVITNIKDILEKMGSLNAGNLVKDWGTSEGTGSMVGTAKNIVAISTDLNNVKSVDSTKMSKIQDMVNAAAKIDVGSFVTKWGQKQASGDLASTARNVLTISTDLGNVKVVDPSKMKKIQDMIEKAGGINFGGFWKNWGASNSSGKLKDSINNIVQISDDAAKVKMVTPAMIANIDNIQKFINKAGGLKFNVTQVTSADLSAMTNQGVALAQKFVDGVKSLFSMAQNAGHQLQSSVWQAIQGQMGAETNQGKALAQAVVNGIKAGEGGAGQAGHSIQSQFWSAIQAHFGDEYGQGYWLARQVVNGLNSQVGSFWSAGDAAANGFAGGIRRNIWQATQAAQSMGSAAASQIRAALGIHSPSKVFQDIGKNVSMGMAQGITDKSGSVAGATKSIVPVIAIKGNQIVSGTATSPSTNTQQAVTGSGSNTSANTGNGGGNITLNVNVGTYAGQPGELNNLATTIWQQIQVIARQHNMAGNLPNIGVRPV